MSLAIPIRIKYSVEYCLYRTADKRRQAFVEIALFLAFLEVDLWVFRSFDVASLRIASYLTLACLFLWSEWRRRGVSGYRIHKASVSRALAEILGTSVVLAFFLFVTASLLKDSGHHFQLHLLSKPAVKQLNWIVSKGLIVAAQQISLQLFIFPLCIDLFQNRIQAVVVSAGLFSLVHISNLVLIGLTFVSAAAWVWFYSRTSRLSILMVSHATLAILVHGAFPDYITFNMRVGS